LDTTGRNTLRFPVLRRSRRFLRLRRALHGFVSRFRQCLCRLRLALGAMG
jgi:hypothetical protein